MNLDVWLIDDDRLLPTVLAIWCEKPICLLLVNDRSGAGLCLPNGTRTQAHRTWRAFCNRVLSTCYDSYIIFGAPPRSADQRQKFVDAWSVMDELLSAACKSQWRSFPQRPGTFYLLVLFFVASFLPTRPAAAVATPNTINLLVLHLYLCVTVLAASCGQGWGSFCVQDACLAAATDAQLERRWIYVLRTNSLWRHGASIRDEKVLSLWVPVRGSPQPGNCSLLALYQSIYRFYNFQENKYV